MHPSSWESRDPRSLPHARTAALVLGGALVVAVLSWLIWNGDAVAAFKREAGPLTFFSAMALLPALGFPLTPFFVMAGATFGSRAGLIGCAIALSFNLALCYWIARSGLRRPLLSLLERFDYDIPNFENESRSALRFVVLVKVTPGLPGFVKNYMLGLMGVPFWTFFLASLAFTGAYALALVYLGDSLRDHDISNATLAVLAVLVLALVVWLWCRHKGQGA